MDTIDKSVYNIHIGTGEKGGIIVINPGFYSEQFSLYEFHLINEQVSINKITGIDFITSNSYKPSEGVLVLNLSTTWLRVRIIFI